MTVCAAAECADRPAARNLQGLLDGLSARLLDAIDTGDAPRQAALSTPLTDNLELHVAIRPATRPFAAVPDGHGPTYERRVADATPRYYFL